MAARTDAASAAASGPGSGAAPPSTVASGPSRSKPASASSGSPWLPSDTSVGRRPMARSRSTVRFRAIDRSHVPSDASAGSNSSARFQSARNVSCTTSSAMPPIAREPERDGMDAVDVPVVERREGLLRAARDGPDERSLVGSARAALRHPLRAPAPSGFGRLAALRARSAAGGPRSPC